MEDQYVTGAANDRLVEYRALIEARSERMKELTNARNAIADATEEIDRIEAEYLTGKMPDDEHPGEFIVPTGKNEQERKASLLLLLADDPVVRQVREELTGAQVSLAEADRLLAVIRMTERMLLAELALLTAGGIAVEREAQP